jgi:hypothetical protein
MMKCNLMKEFQGRNASSTVDGQGYGDLVGRLVRISLTGM